MNTSLDRRQVFLADRILDDRAKKTNRIIPFMTHSILVIHGPNLQLLGEREVSVYGRVTLDQINAELSQLSATLSLKLDIHQCNHEGDIVDLIGNARQKYAGILINPAAYTHTSVAIRDALSACALPAVEVHLSHVMNREDFRKVSLTAPACVGQVMGFGKHSYLLGLQGLVSVLESKGK